MYSQSFEAITAPVAQEQIHYQRLETLGDTVLKFVASVNLLAEYRYWHEGYLARKKDHAVSNASLAKAASTSLTTCCLMISLGAYIDSDCLTSTNPQVDEY